MLVHHRIACSELYRKWRILWGDVQMHIQYIQIYCAVHFTITISATMAIMNRCLLRNTRMSYEVVPLLLCSFMIAIAESKSMSFVTLFIICVLLGS